jgi:hypothetical protein
MKEIIINVPEDTVELVRRIGGTIEKEKSRINDKAKKKTRPLDFFDIPLDPKTYRVKLWRKFQNYS